MIASADNTVSVFIDFVVKLIQRYNLEPIANRANYNTVVGEYYFFSKQCKIVLAVMCT